MQVSLGNKKSLNTFSSSSVHYLIFLTSQYVAVIRILNYKLCLQLWMLNK